ncbi:MAG TPA: DUF4142 domain-containing protein [Chitinophaga sp.]|nr:DUF4142 domain-containing protein [Chitinophaga sp.]
MRRKHILLTACLLLSTFAFTACDDDDDDVNTPEVTVRDQAFITQASYGNRAEIDFGKLADSLSTNDSVKVFGQMMTDDHTGAQDELESLADDWDANTPDAPDSVHLAIKQQLMLMTGHMFDTAYINGQVRDHQATIALFEYAADSSDAQALRDYANKYLPAIRMHYDHAVRIAATLE